MKSVIALFSSLLMLSGCSLLSPGTNPADPLQNSDTSLELTLEAGYDLNPNDRDEASPLKIRLYELQAADFFSRAGFLDLFDQDSAVLQDSLIKAHRIPIQLPGQTTRFDITLNPATRYIAILAEFARYQNADARAIAPIRIDARNIGRLAMEGNSLYLTISPELTPVDRAKQLLTPFSGAGDSSAEGSGEGGNKLNLPLPTLDQLKGAKSDKKQ
ncbi:type VI secretion system lipoprotein TssJ [Endozoicomonadaceae bacterium StTr2]